MQLGATSLEFLGNLLEKTEKTGGFFFVCFFFLILGKSHMIIQRVEGMTIQ